jgi:hypothetical protein
MKRENRREKMKHAKLVCLGLFAAAPAMAVPPGPPPVEVAGTVDANVVNTVDANVVNTVDTSVTNIVDANLVTTVLSDGLVGLDFGPGVAINVQAFLGSPRRLLSISTGIAPDVPGEFCSFSVKAGVGDTTTITPIGFSAMSNGEVANVSRNYTVPIEPVEIIEWEISSSSGGSCWISLSFVTEPSESFSASARAAAAESPVRLEIR